jgi:hypothetical protein
MTDYPQDRDELRADKLTAIRFIAARSRVASDVFPLRG